MSKPFDLLALFAKFAHERQVPLTAPGLIKDFLASAEGELEKALDDEALLHGTRIENQFEALVLTLGQFKLLKPEDNGRVHAAETMRAPDFRIVLDDGRQWLVEVKNVYCEDPLVQEKRYSAAYMGSLDRYAAAVNVPLKLAIFWARWQIWTLVDPSHFRTADGGVEIKMMDAIPASELGVLGDVSLRTTPPLRIQYHASPDHPRGIDAEGIARFIIDRTVIFSGNVELTDPKDRQLATIMAYFGEWNMGEPIPRYIDSELAGVEYIVEPEEPSGDESDGIGFASRIFGRFYAAHTVEGGRVIQLYGQAVPDWFAPLATWDFGSSKLPLWVLRMMPVAPKNLPRDDQSG